MHVGEEGKEDYHVLQIVRGAGRNKPNYADPKVAMHQWSLDKVQEHVPSVNPATAAMLLRAEARTVSAVLHCKSSRQTLEIVNAALKRAALPTVVEQQQQQQADVDSAALASAMTTQAEALRALATQLQMMTTRDDMTEIVKMMHTEHILHNQASNKLVVAEEALQREVAASAQKNLDALQMGAPSESREKGGEVLGALQEKSVKAQCAKVASA